MNPERYNADGQRMGRSPATHTRYHRLLSSPDDLDDFLDSARLGQLLGFSRFLAVELAEDEVLETTSQIRERVDSLIIEQLHQRHRRADHREHREMLTYLSDLGFEITTLSTGKGDVATKRVKIERKEDDLIPSLFDGRHLRQLGSMREEAEFSYLVVTKSYDAIRLGARERGVSEQTLLSFIASLCAVGYPPIFIDNRHDASVLIHKITEKIEDDKVRLYVPRPKRPTSTEYRNALIEGLPRIGSKLRRRITKAFPTISDLCNASIEELSEVEGVGSNTAKKIYDALHSA